MKLTRSCQREGMALLTAFFCLHGLALFGQVIDPIDPVIGPRIRIVSPANYAYFRAGTTIPIFTFVVDAPVTTNVEIYANGTNNLGSAYNIGLVSPNSPTPGDGFMSGDPILQLNREYLFAWTNVPAGSYALTAVAGRTSNMYYPVPAGTPTMITSAPVNITVVAPTNISTFGTDIVSVVAIDPIAIVGTNAWTWHGSTNLTPDWGWITPNLQPLTNWGPRAAFFAVRRAGEETNAVTVAYTLGGTATNGVDYAKLPGTVTISASNDCALIPVVPIDHGPPYLAKTVILYLTADTNTPPDYLVGHPDHAAGLITHLWPRPMPWWLSDRSFHLNEAGPDGTWYVLEVSSDLVNWTPVAINQVFQGSIDHLDPDAPSKAVQFYNVVPFSGPPPQ